MHRRISTADVRRFLARSQRGRAPLPVYSYYPPDYGAGLLRSTSS
jgi:hypothetical protein